MQQYRSPDGLNFLSLVRFLASLKDVQVRLGIYLEKVTQYVVEKAVVCPVFMKH